MTVPPTCSNSQHSLPCPLSKCTSKKQWTGRAFPILQFNSENTNARGPEPAHVIGMPATCLGPQKSPARSGSSLLRMEEALESFLIRPKSELLTLLREQDFCLKSKCSSLRNVQCVLLLLLQVMTHMSPVHLRCPGSGFCGTGDLGPT